MHEVIKPLSK